MPDTWQCRNHLQRRYVYVQLRHRSQNIRRMSISTQCIIQQYRTDYINPNISLTDSRPSASNGAAIALVQVPLNNKNPITIHIQSLSTPLDLVTTLEAAVFPLFRFIINPSLGFLGSSFRIPRRRWTPRARSNASRHVCIRSIKRKSNVFTRSRFRFRLYLGRMRTVPGCVVSGMRIAG